MPELPEVEVVRRGLEAHLPGLVIEKVEVRHPRAVRTQSAEEVEFFLTGARITGLGRRGKFLWIDLSTGKKLHVHLGMSGQMLLSSRGLPDTRARHPHLRIRAWLRPGPITSDAALPGVGADSPCEQPEEGLILDFVDQRTFGLWAVVDAVPDPHQPEPRQSPGDSQPATIPATVAASRIAPDPFEPAFDPGATAARMKKKNTEIKRVLLDQTIVSGIGNIYADEALFLAGIRPRRRASGLSGKQLRRILECAAAVMSRALDQGGTSFDSLYVNVNGASGYFARSLNVYGRENQPCTACGTPVKRITFMGRSSHYCPQCQK